MSVQPKLSRCELDASYCKFGSETLQRLLQTFEDQIGGVIESKDIEYVHKMRVASRRLRATMPLFRGCYSKKRFKRWLREIKNVTRLLGEARDLDVQIAFVQNYMQHLKAGTETWDLETLLKSQKQQRKKIQANVIGGLRELQDSGILEDMKQVLEGRRDESTRIYFDATSVREQAHWHISARLDDLLALEEYVHKENEILKHHEMRIKTKLLRYTMEAFAPLYQDQLVNEIKAIKDFQDVLGEMHDLDVWVSFLPKFATNLKTKRKRRTTTRKAGPVAKNQEDLRDFFKFIKETNKRRYGIFVRMWDEKVATDFFGKLHEKTGVLPDEVKQKLTQALAKPKVKVAVLSDIHANIHALEAVFQDAENRGADIFLNAGDSVGFGACPNEVVELLHSKSVLSVLGNFDCEVLKGAAPKKGLKKTAIEFARKELSKKCESYLQSLPPEITLTVASMKLLMVHGSPESMEEHIYHDTPEARLQELAEEARVDLIIGGHSHEQFHRQSNEVSFLNPGSVGRPGDGNPQTAYAMLTFNPFEVELFRLDYDVEAAAQALRKKGLPESFSQMLLCGVSLETILEEDEVRKNDSIRDCKRLVENCEKISKEYLSDTEHIKQVKKLALSLFDGLTPLHKLGKRERCWLECAASLHDVGLSESVKGHHKKSTKIILNDTKLSFTSTERRIIASIARYHRKGLPKRKHYNLTTLKRKEVKKVALLSGILRVADALDYSHQSTVKELKIKTSQKRVVAECFANAPSPLEQQAFNKKKDLFEKVFDRKLVLA